MRHKVKAEKSPMLACPLGNLTKTESRSTVRLNNNSNRTSFSDNNFSFLCFFLFFFRYLKDWLGPYGIQWFFAGVSICGFVYALLILPETHGKKLSDIQAQFNGEAKKQKMMKKQQHKKNGVANRKPKQTLETVQESERMMKESV